ncbi:TetR/AcrR family transcriptional regulator [Streptomyces sp. S07_1.15]|uniref:TetR/AcrR family transcriptional regulator n=1 Tax=Streptomyces sp. S07_1.15 TaxID=2873925 RepID=UPI001D15A1E9|nr:TetR/AcrR family transcriptional regulator [Streptomyces sp. S07_1.15]MCC3655400.1 TetR/AcrR family transcriptional regulator [Streptomyces sp. S07_1.15]
MAPAERTPRERYRKQVKVEIKERAREQIATAGVSALSLNAIAKRMGLSGPALYRYFANRDELITELVRDAYRSLADTFRRAAGEGAGLTGLARALRRWALDDPQRYFLVYGTPVPGYRAPEDTREIAAEVMAVLIDACADAPGEPRTSAAAAGSFEEHLADHRAWDGGHPAPAPALRRALAFWTRLHGVLSLELAGQFGGMGFDPERLFAAELESLTAGTTGTTGTAETAETADGA